MAISRRLGQSGSENCTDRRRRFQETRRPRILGRHGQRNNGEIFSVDGMGIADEAPDYTFPEEHLPRLTVRMVARIQGFPDTWQFMGQKNHRVSPSWKRLSAAIARAVGNSIRAAFTRQFTYADLPDSDVRELRLLEEPEPSNPPPNAETKRFESTNPRLPPSQRRRRSGIERHSCGERRRFRVGAPCVRELRNEEGWQILSHKDRSDLKPGQYLLETTKRVPAFRRGISK